MAVIIVLAHRDQYSLGSVWTLEVADEEDPTWRDWMARNGDEVLVFSADETCFERVSRLWRSEWRPLHWVSDPRVLEAMLVMRGCEALDDSMPESHGPGIVLDFTPPTNTVEPSDPYARLGAGTRQEVISTGVWLDRWLAWYLGATLVVVRHGLQVPLLLVSGNPDQESQLCYHGARLIQRIEPTDTDTSWRRVLTCLHAHISHGPFDHGAADASRRAEASSTGRLVQLAPQIHFDRSRLVVLRGGLESPLTGREAAVLIVLAESPNTYRHTLELSRRVSTSSLYPVEEHSIEQTIYTLRRKLGESAKDARLILERRRLGYALMIEEDIHLASAGVVAHARVRAHG